MQEQGQSVGAVLADANQMHFFHFICRSVGASSKKRAYLGVGKQKPNPEDTMTPHQIQHRVTPYLQQKPVLRAWLFGSQAEGTADENSDIDILVELDYSQHIGLEFVTMWMELSDLLGRQVDLVTVDGVSPYIAPYIAAQKTLIYEK